MPDTAPLPAPSPEAMQHSDGMVQHIRDEIAASGGWISFARYMEMALYAPGLGYYTTGTHKLGEAGDFITAPELSPLFGRTLANQMAEIISASAPHILELGAGSGKLAADMLQEMESLGCLPDSYSILEVSADLRERQKNLFLQQLPHLFHRVHWLDKLPEHFSGAIVANEVLDALPVHRVHWLNKQISEWGVAQDESGFVWQEHEISDKTLLQAAQKINVDGDYASEICLAARGLVSSLACCLTQGAMLFIDYGFGTREFYHPQRATGTLMCHYRHHAHDDPFYLPGLQDITAHVNFTDIAESGIDAGLEVVGYTNQAFFLINNRITELLSDISPEDLKVYLPLSAQLQKLTSPAEMGELFKVLALSKKLTTPLSGFSCGDLTRLL